MGDSDSIASHYDAKKELSKTERSHQETIYMKNLNNWMKSVLIAKHIKSGSAVLDLCCGKGGDLAKFEKQRIGSLVGVDISKESIAQCQSRFNERRKNFPGEFHVADAFSVDLKELVQGKKFHFVSCQFALHYAFETEERIRRCLRNVAENMKLHGIFVCTLPDANQIVKKLRAAPGLSFGNSVYQLTFEQKDTFPLFGHKYSFYLKESIENCVEYVSYFPLLRQLAQEVGLEVIYKKNFHEMYEECVQVPHYRDLLIRMHCVEKDSSVSEEEWEVIGIYSAIAFQKMSEVSFS